MSLILLDGDWDVDGRLPFSWHILEEATETLSYSWSILELIEETLSYAWSIYGTITKTLSYSWHIINAFAATVSYSWEIMNQSLSSKPREIFRKLFRGTVLNSSDRNPLRGDVKRHRWWGSK